LFEDGILPSERSEKEATPAGVGVVGRCGTVGGDSPDVLVGSEAEPRSCASFGRKAGRDSPEKEQEIQCWTSVGPQ
jgi:hypothetical protein